MFSPIDHRTDPMSPSRDQSTFGGRTSRCAMGFTHWSLPGTAAFWLFARPLFQPLPRAPDRLLAESFRMTHHERLVTQVLHSQFHQRPVSRWIASLLDRFFNSLHYAV